ncbi:MAG TPA: glycerophosphodiester phosphodiesterase family protein [Chryseosolibacter sp.]
MSRSFVFLVLLAAGSFVRAQGDEIRDPARSPAISAHRGASRLAPENTLAAFSKAIAMGADFIEVDLRTTSDGREVCLHDASLKRTTGVDSLVNDMSFERVRALSAGHKSGPQYENEKIPSLEDVCELVSAHNRSGSRRVRLYLDCKHIRVDEVLRVLKEYDLLSASVFYGDVMTLLAIRSAAPDARLLPAFPGEEREDEIIRTLRPIAFDVDWHQVNASLVARCHRKGIKVFCDLLDENDHLSAYRKAIAMGVDLIQTDDVEAVKKCREESRNVTPR